MIGKGIKETFTVRTLVLLIAAFLGFTAARLLHLHLLRRIGAISRVPEVSDVVVAVVGGSLIRGEIGQLVIVGAGISLVNNLGQRLGIAWLRVG